MFEQLERGFSCWNFESALLFVGLAVVALIVYVFTSQGSFKVEARIISGARSPYPTPSNY